MSAVVKELPESGAEGDGLIANSNRSFDSFGVLAMSNEYQ
jgi:hypothetical protein